MDTRELFFRAEELFSEARWQELADMLHAEEGGEEARAVIFFWRGRLARAKGDADAAVQALEQVVSLEPQTPLFLMHLAQALEMQQAMSFLATLQEDQTQLTKIESTWRQVLELAPESGLYRASYAEFLVGRQRFDEALALICEARTLCPAHEEIRRLWLRFNLKMGGHFATTAGCNLEAGLRCLLAVLEEIPDLHDALLFAGICCRKLGRREEAISFYQRCCALAREGRAEPDPLPFNDLAELLLASGDLAGAERVVEEGLRLDPESPALRGLRDDLRQRRPLVAPPPGETAAAEILVDTKVSESGAELTSTPSDASSIELQPIAESVRKGMRDVLSGQDDRKWVGGLSELFPPGASPLAYWHAALEESFSNDDDRNWSRYLAVLEVSLSRWQAAVEMSPALAERLKLWCDRLTSLSRRRIDPESGKLLPPDSAYAQGAGIWRELFSTSNFCTRAADTSFGRWLIDRADFWKEELVYYLLHQRPRAFLALLRLMLVLAARLPGFAERCVWLPVVLSSYLNRYSVEGASESRDSSQTPATTRQELALLINGWLETPEPAAPGWTALVASVRQAVSRTRPADVPETVALGDEELTVEAVFRFALEEVLADELMTREETEILRTLRDYLEIPDATYQQLFREVSERASRRQLTRLNRDFSASEFLYRLLLKTMEDGRVTPAEKMLIKRAAAALLIDQQTFNEQYWRAEAEYRRRLTALRAASTGQLEEDPVLRRLRKAEKLNERLAELLKHERTAELRTIIQNACSDVASRAANQKSSSTRTSVSPVVAFLSWEPAVF
ncbi:MAG TPA: tetratricopeptide repeat protein, partial [Candidatus Ozemobacteraceae bacterium]|nr:tetratricopeptide repeat protein [Candidatus Ozemobacteraceae bacterium]